MRMVVKMAVDGMEKKLSNPLFIIDELAKAVKGELVFKSYQDIFSVEIDSRQLQSGALFVPLSGENVDGHEFIISAVGKGAAAFFCKRNVWQRKKEELLLLCEKNEVSCILVEDTLTALQKLAEYHLDKYRGVVRIGITGSSGKTTTKEIIGAVLCGYAQTMVSYKNLNSEIGVPLQAFRVTKNDVYAVFEMGINHEGEMDVLADIVKPDFAVITNIGTAHIGLFGSRENIASEKKKIAKHFTGHETLLIFEEEPFTYLLSDSVRGEVIRYGPRCTKGFEGSRSLGLDGTAINWEGLQIRFPLFGKYNLNNAIAAITLADMLGISHDFIKKGLESVPPLFGRSEIINGDITILKDCYNANPDSVAETLNFFHDINWEGKKVVVLGSMLELGDASEKLHVKTGILAGTLAFDAIFFFGREMESAFIACYQAGFKGKSGWFVDFDKLLDDVLKNTHKNDILLLKGSRGMALERIADRIAGEKK